MKYTDPTGEWVLNIGVFGSAGAGVGGSADIGVSIGGDLTVDIESKDLDVSVGLSKSSGTGVKFGIGASATAGEVHIRYNSTQTKASSLNEVMQTAGNKLNQFEKAIENFIIDKTLEMYGY